jgi:hypothetical protein
VTDAAHADAARSDAWLPDAGRPDLGLPDIVLPPPPDFALPPPPPDFALPPPPPDFALPPQPDALEVDAAVVLIPDAFVLDAALPDAFVLDAALPDAALPDAALPDAALPPAVCPDGLWGPFCENTCACDDALVCNGIETCDRDLGCLAGEPPFLDDADACTLDTCDELLARVVHTLDAAHPACAPRRPAPTVGPLDYGFWHWPGNHRPVEVAPRVEPVMHFSTGYYGLSFDESTGDLGRMGALDTPMEYEPAATRDIATVEGLPAADLRFEAGADAATVRADGFLGANASVINRARLIDGGRFMNRVEIPTVTYSADAAYSGRVEIASMPRHVVFNHTASSSAWRVGIAAHARVVLSGAVLAGLPDATWLEAGRALRLTGADGEAWVFVVYSTPDRPTTLAYADGVLTAETTASVAAGTPLTVSLLAFPTRAAGPAQTAMYLQPTAAATVGYRLLNRAGAVRGTYDAAWDPTLGAYRVPLQPINVAGDPTQTNYDADPTVHNLYGRHELTIDTHGQPDVAVPLAMFSPEKLSLYITGGAPSLRDPDGQPNGLPLQISKNWHNPPNWYHLYTQPTVTGAAPYTMELTVASSRWGRDAYAASHAQLSLIGYNDAGGRWDESALGAFGASGAASPAGSPSPPPHPAVAPSASVVAMNALRVVCRFVILGFSVCWSGFGSAVGSGPTPRLVGRTRTRSLAGGRSAVPHSARKRAGAGAASPVGSVGAGQGIKGARIKGSESPEGADAVNDFETHLLGVQRTCKSFGWAGRRWARATHGFRRARASRGATVLECGPAPRPMNVRCS